jgi:hypothetical protein
MRRTSAVRYRCSDLELGLRYSIAQLGIMAWCTFSRQILERRQSDLTLGVEGQDALALAEGTEIQLVRASP